MRRRILYLVPIYGVPVRIAQAFAIDSVLSAMYLGHDELKPPLRNPYHAAEGQPASALRRLERSGRGGRRNQAIPGDTARRSQARPSRAAWWIKPLPRSSRSRSRAASRTSICRGRASRRNGSTPSITKSSTPRTPVNGADSKCAPAFSATRSAAARFHRRPTIPTMPRPRISPSTRWANRPACPFRLRQ